MLQVGGGNETTGVKQGVANTRRRYSYITVMRFESDV